MADRRLLPQHPARVEVTAKDGAVRWLDDPPVSYLTGVRMVDELRDAGVWPWQQALAHAREAHQPWRRQVARAVAVEERTAVGPDARRVAAELGLPDAGEVRCLVWGGSWLLVLRPGGRRDVLPVGPRPEP